MAGKTVARPEGDDAEHCAASGYAGGNLVDRAVAPGGHHRVVSLFGGLSRQLKRMPRPFGGFGLNFISSDFQPTVRRRDYLPLRKYPRNGIHYQK